MKPDKFENMAFYINGLSTRTGSELVSYLSDFDTNMFLSDSNREVLQKTEQKLMNKRGKAHFFVSDNRDYYQVEEVINRAFKTLKTLDCAINNFSLQTVPTNIIDCSADFMLRSCMSSLSSVFLLMKYELTLMLGLQKKCTIINLFASTKEIDFKNSHATTAFLHAVKGLTISTAKTYHESGISIKSFLVQFEDKKRKGGSISDIVKITDVENPVNESMPSSIQEIVASLLGDK
jgi:NADP-dependent 3-hydroxy acid dehydrogenase YdfG